VRGMRGVWVGRPLAPAALRHPVEPSRRGGKELAHRRKTRAHKHPALSVPSAETTLLRRRTRRAARRAPRRVPHLARMARMPNAARVLSDERKEVRVV
jgi:hypothetical protein